MNVPAKNPSPALPASRIAERTVRAPRFVCRETASAIMPAAMGNRAFIRAWAAHRAIHAARSAK